ncbi:BTAD domain-containing putative transcriptional regulator [Streptomyces canus]|uniref:BTAD domain-containing putative transcriptional regulator n=1 Tax=Streptomyces canus TaxID=58343 RepID=UPI00368C9635
MSGCASCGYARWTPWRNGLTRQGSLALALEAALANVRIEPLRESAHRAVVAAHLSEGNVIEAVRHYRAYRLLCRTGWAWSHPLSSPG